MSWWSNLIGAPVREAVQGVAAVMDEHTVSADERRTDASDMNAQQAAITLADAQHHNRTLFTAGYRPFMAWICALCWAYVLLVRLVAADAAAVAGHAITLPALDGQLLDVLLYFTLAIYGIRTVEKIRRAAQ